MFLALGHKIHLVLYCKPSMSWGPIKEFMALAHIPRLSKQALKYASAGIRTKQTFSQVEYVRSTDAVENYIKNDTIPWPSPN